MSYQFSNNASSVLTAQLLAGGTTVSITPADASKFPIPSGAAFFMGTLQKSTGEFEIVKVTSNPLTGSFTITRAQEGTAAQQFEIGDHFSHRLTAGALNSIAQTTDDLGPLGAVATFGAGTPAPWMSLNTELRLEAQGMINNGPQQTHGEASFFGLVNMEDNANVSGNLQVTGDFTVWRPGGAGYVSPFDRAYHTGLNPYNVLTYSSANSPVTYNKPAGIVKVRVTVIGGGGGGGGATDTTTGGGGGGGGTAIKEILAASLGATETITIGAGGALTFNGGNSSFGAHATGNGGSAGVNGGSGGAGGAGGTASGGDLNFTGQAGPDISTTRGGLTYHGVAGSGGAGSSGASAGGAPGSAGVTGIVIVEEFY